MSELCKRQSLRSHAKRAVVVANQQQNLASSIPFAADSPRPACIKARELNNTMAPFSRGYNVAELQANLKAFWIPRLAAVGGYAKPASARRGRHNRNDGICVCLEMLRPLPFFSDFSLDDAVYVSSLMSEAYGKNLTVNYSTLRKRTECNTIHDSYYPTPKNANRIPKLTWTTANLKGAVNAVHWEKHMEMLAEAIVAIQVMYGVDAIEMMCKAVELSDTVDPALVPKTTYQKERKPAKKQKGTKRSRAAEELELDAVAVDDAAVTFSPPTRNLRPRRTPTYSSDDEIVIKPEPVKRKPVKKAVLAAAATATTTTTAAPTTTTTPSTTPFAIDLTASKMAYLNHDAEEEAEFVMDDALSRDSEEILLYFPDPIDLLLLDDLKVFEMFEEEVKQEVKQEKKEHQTLQQLLLPDMLPELHYDDCFLDF